MSTEVYQNPTILHYLVYIKTNTDVDFTIISFFFFLYINPNHTVITQFISVRQGIVNANGYLYNIAYTQYTLCNITYLSYNIR